MVRINDREYRPPARTTVVVCLDGSSADYIHAAIDAGVAPFLRSLALANQMWTATAAMPTFTNPNNVSIVTGVPPSKHGICGNFFLDPPSGRAVMMNDASYLRAPTILAELSRAGARVAVVTAKDKLRLLLAAGLAGTCVSAEQEGQPVYGPQLSEHVLRRGVDIVRSSRPDLLYLSTSDFVQHAYAPGSPEANTFYGVVDTQLAALDRAGVTLVVTADHGMSSKTDASGRPRIVFLQVLCDEWLGSRRATVILPITDPYVGHHGSLGSFATVYVPDADDHVVVTRRLLEIAGIEAVLDRDAASRTFELPADRVGDLVVCADRAHVIGTRPADHDLSALHGPLRSHGGLAEREVPMLSNRRLAADAPLALRNFDAFQLALDAA